MSIWWWSVAAAGSTITFLLSPASGPGLRYDVGSYV